MFDIIVIMIVAAIVIWIFVATSLDDGDCVSHDLFGADVNRTHDETWR